MVLVEADLELLDPSAREGVARYAFSAGSDAHRIGRARERAPGVDRSHAELPPDRVRDVPPLQRRLACVRSACGAHRRHRARDDARLVFPRTPNDDGHAVRRTDVRRDGFAHARALDGRERARAYVAARSLRTEVEALGVAPR